MTKLMKIIYKIKECLECKYCEYRDGMTADLGYFCAHPEIIEYLNMNGQEIPEDIIDDGAFPDFCPWEEV